jgi:myo-inositol 2-dehydrogenase / D-chiro-inositol 1-dehydrogenase
MSEQQNRRDFLKTTGALAAGAAATLLPAGGGHAAGSDEIRVGVIGCGGRGSGAASNVLHAAKGVKIVALGDVFEFRLKECRDEINKALKDRAVTELGNKAELEGRCFHGLDAYKKVLDSGINYVILATPPGFRPTHLEAAVAKGVNIFTEKPVGVDGPGIRKVLEAAKEAEKKRLGVAAGTQRRHQTSYREVMKRVHGGDIGQIVALRGYWNQGSRIWFRDKSELGKHGVPVSDLAYQLHNWYHFVWTCGDHIVEQHVHNLDVCNWAMGAHPIRAVASGGRAALPQGDPNELGHIFDHFTVDYVYPGGVHMLSMCRQIEGADGSVSEAVAGTKGSAETADRSYYRVGGKSVLSPRKDNEPYVQEHTDLIESIRKNEPINELKNVAESTLTAIMGRMAAYTGKVVTWEKALNSKENLMPAKLDWDMKLKTPPVAVPGKTKLL